MTSLLKQVLDNSPLRDFSTPAQAAVLAVGLPILAVVLNVLSQLVGGLFQIEP
jgi:hypothetical protein